MSAPYASRRLRSTPPLLALLAQLALVGCSDDSAGSVTDVGTTGTTTGVTSETTTGIIPTSGFTDGPTQSYDTVNPDTSLSATSTTTDTTGEVTATAATITTGEDPTTTTDASTSTTTTTSTTTGEDSTTGCETGGQLCEIPPEEQVPTDKPDGVPMPLPGVYDDEGEAPIDGNVRALIGFPTRDREALEQHVADIYNPSSPDFAQYMTVPEWMAAHAPPQADYDLIKEWLASEKMTVNFDSSNRMVVAFSGSVADFNDAFSTTLHICLRKNPQQGLPPFEVYCTLGAFTLPKFVADRTTGLLTADLPADVGKLPGEGGTVVDDPPGNGGFDPDEIAKAYEVDDLYAAGSNGAGVKLGIVGAATFHGKDLQTFWKSFGITRKLPTRVQMMEPVVTRITETILDTQWSSSMAPGADVINYEGPDSRNTSLLYVFNEAIARGEVSVLTDSFAHREDSEPLPLRHQYDEAALMGAALGITVISASGDSARPDIPCTSPYVVCVGGTSLNTLNGNVISETAWEESGSGDAKTFDRPQWQMGIVPNNRRATVDLALNADPVNGYWVRRFGNWEIYGGTSFAAPVFAGMVAVINSYRIANGEPVVGLLTPIVYTDPAVRASFRDVQLGGTDLFQAKKGWDYPTGWGAPRAKKLADALP